jgi:hypothetical protein
MNIRLDDGAGDRIAAAHEDGSSAIDATGGGAPVSVDGGLGTPELLKILAAVSGTAYHLTLIHGVLGKQVHEAASRIADTDEQVATLFSTLTKDDS